MKKLLISGLMALACVTGTAVAANTDTGDSTAWILVPLTLNDGDLDFGRIATNDTACTVRIEPQSPGTGIRTTAGGSCWLDPADTGNDADWATNGEPGYTYTVELTANTDMAAFTPCANDNSIDIDLWQLISDDVALTTFSGLNGDSGTVGGLVLDGPPGAGSDAFYIGATAHLAADQCPGAYNGTYTLKATYP